ncbi:MAG: agmatinase [Polaribacter sp.]|uniref:agmatinase n=1 Tax=Polaribacter sp. TaxID=1920175 RepID=UPI003BB06ACF
MKTTKNYAGIPQEFGNLSTSKIVIIPVSYNGTSNAQNSDVSGPEAFFEASENIELYDIETDSEAFKEGVYIADAISENDSPKKVVEEVHQTTKKYINRNKFVTIFGGEHSISIGTVRAFNECFSSLSVLHIGAHTDLRKEYDGSKYNNACAMYEANSSTNLVQVGIRSMDISEKREINSDKVFFAHEMAVNEDWMDDVVDQLSTNVFITFDLHGIDPSIMPSVTNPEPGGLFYYETLEFLKRVFDEKNVVGFDMVELNPNKNDKSSNALAAKLFYKMLSYKFASNDDSYDIGNEDDNSVNPFSKLSKFKNDDDDF